MVKLTQYVLYVYGTSVYALKKKIQKVPHYLEGVKGTYWGEGLTKRDNKSLLLFT